MLPFGIASTPEPFQKRLNFISEGQDGRGEGGVTCSMDDVLIHGRDKAEQDTRLKKVMERLEAANVTLNSKKCDFWKSTLNFLRYLLSKHGLLRLVVSGIWMPHNQWQTYVDSWGLSTSSGNSLHGYLSSHNHYENCWAIRKLAMGGSPNSRLPMS